MYRFEGVNIVSFKSSIQPDSAQQKHLLKAVTTLLIQRTLLTLVIPIIENYQAPPLELIGAWVSEQQHSSFVRVTLI